MIVARPVPHEPEGSRLVGAGRRVDILGTQVGRAYSLADVAEFCRRAGLDELDLDLDSDDMVEWIGGGLDVWE
ncbi:hypothetical protein ABH931_006652 [Streptacidiphilus sp. MAP12-33]